MFFDMDNVIPKVPDMLSRSYQESSSKHEPRLVSQKMMEKVKVKTVCLSRRPSVRLFVKNMAMILLKGQKEWTLCLFLARCCLGQVPGGAPFSQRSEQATACTNRMQIRN